MAVLKAASDMVVASPGLGMAGTSFVIEPSGDAKSKAIHNQAVSKQTFNNVSRRSLYSRDGDRTSNR